MKKLLIIPILFLSLSFVKAQGFYNNTWCFGDSAMFKYNNGNFDSNIPTAMSAIETSASISDSLGNLLFYTNGIKIWNRNNIQMSNSDSIENGPFAVAFGSSTTQGALILRIPNSLNLYYVFLLKAQSVSPALQYCLVDMSLNGGLGDVILKNQYIYTDELSEKMKAVRHANGRDWWLYLHKFDSNDFVRYLITPAGIEGPFYQSIGSVFPVQDNAHTIGQMTISPDGSKLAIVSYRVIDIFNIDRCTGELSDFKNIVEFDYPNYGAYGCTISSNNQFLYFSSWDSLFQISLTDEFPYDNRFLVYFEPLYSSSLYAISINQLENLDNKIIVACGLMGTSHVNLPPNNTNLSIINQPNLLHGACDFQPYSIPLSHGHIMGGLPNMPNYNLGALDNSPCDTLGMAVNEVTENENAIVVFPNPSTGEITVSAKGIFELYDVTGRKLFYKNCNSSNTKINLPEQLCSGVYLYRLTQTETGFSKSGMFNLLK